MSSLSFVSSSIVYYLVFKVQLISFETLQLLPRVTRRCLSLRSPSVPSSFFSFFLLLKFLVGSSGLEPPTSRLSGVRSNHLSYEPSKVVEISGIEPLTSCVQGRRSPS